MKIEIELLHSIRVHFVGDIWIIGIDGYVMLLDDIEKIEYVEGLDYLDIRLRNGDEFEVKGKYVDELKVFLEILKTRGGKEE